VALEAKINALRDLPPSASLLPPALPKGSPAVLDYQRLSTEAGRRRPEVLAAEARIEGAEIRSKRVEKQYRPDFGVGVTYTFVDPRQDTPGQVLPPDGNGDDIFGIQGAITIPVWRRKLKAGTAEAMELELAAGEARRAVLATIDADLGDLLQRIPLTWRQLRLLEDVLVLQAEESVRSAQSGYVSGSLNALDLLDAEHVFFDAETAVARARADYAVQLAELEGTTVKPIEQDSHTEERQP
jgi:outer membrane protein TolC